MRFYKYHGTGNDFVVVEAPGGRPGWATPDGVRFLCDRHRGIGADGVLLIEQGRRVPHFMRVLNADGSEAEMCGNGIRCVARHLRERMGVPFDEIPIETAAGVKRCRLRFDDRGLVESVAVSLGAPILDRERIPMAGTGQYTRQTAGVLGRDFTGRGVSMGNPHFVVFEGVETDEAERYGAALSSSPLFPHQANVEFARQLGPGWFEVKVFERGCGLTLACGTGAAATAVAAVLENLAPIGQPLRIDLPGGGLVLTVASEFVDVTLEGPATPVFDGEIAVPD